MTDTNPINPRKELALIQNQFLLLFLKYKLGFRCSESAFTEVPHFWYNIKHLLAHCFLHAVFGNSTKQDPQVKLDVKKKGSKYFIEISSSGNAATFHQTFEEYSEDTFVQEFMNLIPQKQNSILQFSQMIEVEHDQVSFGSLIRLELS